MDLSIIVTNAETEGFDAGSVFISFRRADEINLETAAIGSSRVIEGLPERDRAISALRWWKDIRDTALEENVSKQDLASYFARLPEDDKAAILEGVDALLAGQEDVEFREVIHNIFKWGEKPEWKDVSILAIEKGSPAHNNQIKAEEFHMTNLPSVVDEDLMTAYWSALQELGLLEC